MKKISKNKVLVTNSLMSKESILWLLILSPILSSIISFIFKVNAMSSIALFLILPSVLLTFANQRAIKKSAIFALLTVPMLLLIDYISHLMGQWIVPNSIFPKIFNVVPVEDLVWIFFLTYLTVMFYEFFLDSSRKREVKAKKFILLIPVFVGIPLIWFIFGFIYPRLFKVEYFYLLWGVAGLLIPTLLIFVKYKMLRLKLLVIGSYFFYLGIIYELNALALNWWYFPIDSKFVGWVSIFGYNFPIEEFVFWIILCAAGTISWYEYFDDDLL